MASQLKKTAYKIILGVFMASFIVASCNNDGKEKKDDKMEDTTKVEQTPPPPIDTTKMDTADTRPVKTGD